MKKAVRAGALALGLCLAAWSVPVLHAADAAGDEKPYKVVDGKVDRGTFNGYRRYGNSCLACHGPDGGGSSYAPNLTESLKHLDQGAFAETVINGRRNLTAGNQNVMPAFGEVEDVALHLEDIYAYLKGRSDGAIGRGRPNRMEN